MAASSGLDGAVARARQQLGPGAQVFEQPHGVLVDNGVDTVFVVEAGYDLSKSGIRSRNCIVWLGGQDRHLTARLIEHDHEFEVHVVARDRIEHLRARMVQLSHGSGQVKLYPHPPIDWTTLDELRPVPLRTLEDPEVWLAQLDRGDKQEALWSLWRQWVGPLPVERRDGPLLRVFLQLAQKHKVCHQNMIVEWQELQHASLPAVFYVENQGCCHWTVDDWDIGTVRWYDGAPADVDPDAEGVVQGPLDEFLIQLVLFEQMMGAPCWVSGNFAASLLTDAIAPFREVPLGPWCWPAEGVRFLVDPGMIGNAWLDGDDAWLQVGAKTPLPLAHFRQFDVAWDVMDA